MLLHAVIIPPRAQVEALVAVLRSVPVSSEIEPVVQKGLLRRLGRRDEHAEPAPSRLPLDPVRIDRLRFPVTGFGNLTSNDAQRLAGALVEAATALAPVPVRFSGGAALEFPGDRSVWAKLAGDLDALHALARGVTQSVEALGFFVDRRAFRPMLSLGTVTEATTGPYLEAVVAALDAFRGEEWVVDHITLTTQAFNADQGQVEYRQIQLG